MLALFFIVSSFVAVDAICNGVCSCGSCKIDISVYLELIRTNPGATVQFVRGRRLQEEDGLQPTATPDMLRALEQEIDREYICSTDLERIDECHDDRRFLSMEPVCFNAMQLVHSFKDYHDWHVARGIEEAEVVRRVTRKIKHKCLDHGLWHAEKLARLNVTNPTSDVEKTIRVATLGVVSSVQCLGYAEMAAKVVPERLPEFYAKTFANFTVQDGVCASIVNEVNAEITAVGRRRRRSESEIIEVDPLALGVDKIQDSIPAVASVMDLFFRIPAHPDEFEVQTEIFPRIRSNKMLIEQLMAKGSATLASVLLTMMSSTVGLMVQYCKRWDF